MQARTTRCSGHQLLLLQAAAVLLLLALPHASAGVLSGGGSRTSFGSRPMSTPTTSSYRPTTAPVMGYPAATARPGGTVTGIPAAGGAMAGGAMAGGAMAGGAR